MNAQGIFDTVARHLLTQGERAVAEDECGGTDCVYRSPGGLKCAVGCLIPDEHYDRRMEGVGVSLFGLPEEVLSPTHRQGAKLLREALAHAGVDVDEHRLLLLALQELHDEENEGESRWSLALRKFAADWQLSAAVLDEFAA